MSSVDDKLVEAIELSCPPCNFKEKNEYNPPITKLEYLADCVGKICPTCRTACRCKPIPSTITEEFTNTKKNLYTPEQWQKLLNERYQTLKDAVYENMPSLWISLELVLSIKPILYIKDISLPLIMILLGAPAGAKTAGLTLLRKSSDAYYTDNFTPKAFVSHNSGMKEERLREIDLLPRIKNKLVLAPEMAPLFAKKEEDLKEILGIITRIADGQGLVTDSGSCGQRGYTDDHMFVWIGAAVEIPPYVYQHLGRIGAKLYFFRLPRQSKSKDDYLQQLLSNSFKVRYDKIAQALEAYLNMFDMSPMMSLDEESGLKKTEWDKSKDDIEAQKIIVDLGILLSHLRAYVPTWDTTHTQGLNYAYTFAIKEEPDRAMEQLTNIARGHALSMGRNYITMDDLSVPIKVVLSTASIERVRVFDLLLAHKGKLTTSIITKSLNMTHHPAHRTMAEFQAIELVDLVEPSHPTEEKTIFLKYEFKWFLSPEFDKLRDKFRPEDYREYIKKKGKGKEKGGTLEEKTPPRSDPDPEMVQAIEEAAKASTESIIYKCPICKFSQFKTEVEQHKKSCSGLVGVTRN